ncbi:RNA polymerase II-binding domain-containing protein [Geopyxis carbonaria]|nr:RNA polymerase II-binding domain-containing protein [Geopyxis carbonaria]
MSSSYSDETVRSKLSALNDTQDSIVAVAQWIMFHRRQAKRSTELWLERMKESSPHRKLNLVYLANEIVQQSKGRNKPEFLNSFAPIVADGTEAAYKGCPSDIQGKIRRVIQVWRERSIFNPEIQVKIEARVDDVDKSKTSGAKGFGGLKLGGGFLGGGGASTANVPLELVPIMKTHKDLAEKASSVTISTGTANTEFQKQFDTENLPPPPVYAARLSSLLKTLDTADHAIKGAIEARKAHIRNIERLLEQSRTALVKDENTAHDIQNKKSRTEQTKNDVENMIVNTMDDNSNGDGCGQSGGIDSKSPDEIKSPEIEALTPPAQIVFEPEPPVSASALHHQHSLAPGVPPQPPEFHSGASELLASLSGPLHNGGGLKRAKDEDSNMFEGIDEDLINIFKNEETQQKRAKMEVDMQPDDDEYHP